MCCKSKNFAVINFGLGALLGAGAGVFLSSKKGRKAVKQVWKQVEPYLEDALDGTKDEVKKITHKAQKTAEEVKVRVEDLKGLVGDKAKDFRSKTDDLAENFEFNAQDREKRTSSKTKLEDETGQTISQVKDYYDEKLPHSPKKPVKPMFFKGV